MPRLKRPLILALAAALLLATPAAWAAISGTFSASITINDQRTIGLNTGTLSTTVSPFVTFSDGSGANQIGTLYQNSLSMTAGAYALNLNGVLLDNYGTTVNLLRVKALFIKNTSSHTITVGAGTNTMTTLLNSTGTLTLPAGAWVVVATPDSVGWVVTPTTACMLNFTGVGTDSFQVVVGGSSS